MLVEITDLPLDVQKCQGERPDSYAVAICPACYGVSIYIYIDTHAHVLTCASWALAFRGAPIINVTFISHGLEFLGQMVFRG